MHNRCSKNIWLSMTVSKKLSLLISKCRIFLMSIIVIPKSQKANMQKYKFSKPKKYSFKI